MMSLFSLFISFHVIAATMNRIWSKNINSRERKTGFCLVLTSILFYPHRVMPIVGFLHWKLSIFHFLWYWTLCSTLRVCVCVCVCYKNNVEFLRCHKNEWLFRFSHLPRNIIPCRRVFLMHLTSSLFILCIREKNVFASINDTFCDMSSIDMSELAFKHSKNQ